MTSAPQRTLPAGLVDHLAAYLDRAWVREGGVDPVDELTTFAVLSPQDLARVCALLLDRMPGALSIVSRALADVRVDSPVQLGIAHALCSFASGVPSGDDVAIVSCLRAGDPQTLTAASAAALSLMSTAHAFSASPLPPGRWLRSALAD